MSSRDLPAWARAGAAALLLVGAWFSARSEAMVGALGESVVELSAGIIAVSIMLGMGLPLDLWPRAPRRRQFSIGWALAVTSVFAALILAASATPVPEVLFQRSRLSTVVLMLAGGAVWGLAWGRTDQLAFGRWYGMAALYALAPVAIAALVYLGVGGAIAPGLVLQVVGLQVAIAAAGALVTQELAFRRVLIGQSGDAGLAAVVGAAMVFGAWHTIVGAGEASPVPIGLLAMLNGVILGALYLMSRSLLVPALYHGLNSGVFTAMAFASSSEPGGAVFAETTWIPMLVATLGVATALSIQVVHRSGLLGTLLSPRADDAAGD